MKIINKLSNYLEEELSVEEIFGRAIDMEIIIFIVQNKFAKEYNSVNYMKIWMKKDDELKRILEGER